VLKNNLHLGNKWNSEGRKVLACLAILFRTSFYILAKNQKNLKHKTQKLLSHLCHNITKKQKAPSKKFYIHCLLKKNKNKKRSSKRTPIFLHQVLIAYVINCVYIHILTDMYMCLSLCRYIGMYMCMSVNMDMHIHKFISVDTNI
jgi:hypothetical protein